MGAPFDVFAFANDVGKGVGGLVKGAADVAAGAVDIAANLVEGAASELAGVGEHHDAPELPEPRYRDGMVSEANNVAVSYVRVRRIELDHEQRVVEGPEKYLRLSHRGLELMDSEPDLGQRWLAKLASAFDDEPLAPLDPETAIRVRNCSVYSKEKDAGLDWLRNASIGGIIGALTPGKFVAAVGGAILGATLTPGPERRWFLDILDYDADKWVFELENEEAGKKVLTFLDEHLAL